MTGGDKFTPNNKNRRGGVYPLPKYQPTQRKNT
nr:MAG TPA: hypothetical protein [Caudoviricetes sp.]